MEAVLSNGEYRLGSSAATGRQYLEYDNQASLHKFDPVEGERRKEVSLGETQAVEQDPTDRGICTWQGRRLYG